MRAELTWLICYQGLLPILLKEILERKLARSQWFHYFLVENEYLSWLDDCIDEIIKEEL